MPRCATFRFWVRTGSFQTRLRGAPGFGTARESFSGTRNQLLGKAPEPLGVVIFVAACLDVFNPLGHAATDIVLLRLGQRRARKQKLLGFLQSLKRRLTRNRGKAGEKILQSITGFETLEQGSKRHLRAGKHGCAMRHA